MRSKLPITGLVGVLGGKSPEVQAALRDLEAAEAAKPDALELRADLFENPAEALDLIPRLRESFPILFTVRLKGHGGSWEGDENARLGLYRRALDRGAALVDAEWDSDAARRLSALGAPLVASHHDFVGRIGPSQLERLVQGMLALHPTVLKCVPTAEAPEDSMRMLEWSSSAGAGEPPRVGFAMGEVGFPSRVLSMAWGSPYTYASLGRAVAPGQATVREMRELYRAPGLTRRSKVFGVAGNPVAHSLSPYLHNRAFASHGIDAVYLPLRTNTFPELLEIAEPLGLNGLSVTIPFKEDAFKAADEPDGRSRACGASNTLLWDRSDPVRPRIRAFNTDFDGVLEPLRRRNIEVKGLTAAILGNGGAARAAARALKEGGARVTLCYRNPDRGREVASSLGVEDGGLLQSLARGRHRLIVNATPLGLHEGDPSPIRRDVFDSDTWAFDMIYNSPETAFLAEARAAGAQTIAGREMLICQGLAQFRHFTGQEATYAEFEAAFLLGCAARCKA